MYNNDVNMGESEKSFGKTIIERCKAKTPPFFKKMRLIGLIMIAAGSVLVATPIAIPAIFITIGGYLIVAGSVATAVSQAAVQSEEEVKKKEY